MGKMEFSDVLVKEKKEKVYDTQTKRYKNKLTTYGRMWKLLMKSAKEGKEVIYEEYTPTEGDHAGELCCKGSIAD